MITLTRRLTVAVAVLALAAAGAGCGRSGGDDSSDVASIDESSAAAPDEDTDDGGGSSGPDSQEFRDAMLEYAECMRDHGIDMPDPEFEEDGGVTQIMPEGEAAPGPEGPSEEFEAADEACQPILEDAMPEAEDLSPEELAERQDQMLAMAQCMRDKGYDMPDPQVDSNGRFRVERRAGPSSDDGPPEDQEQFQEDMESCSEEAGLPDSPVGGGVGMTRGSGG